MPHSIVIQGKEFTVNPPYAAGHVLNEAEASQLNQTWAENIGNNFRKKIKEAVEAGSFDQSVFQTQLDEYANEYEMGVRRASGGGVSRDPVMAEAMNLARKDVKAQLKKKGHDLKNYDAEQINALAAKFIERKPSYREQAEQIVAIRRQAAAEAAPDVDVDELFDGLEQTPASEQAPQVQADYGEAGTAAA